MSLSKPVLSVAIPAHNEENYIGKCITSILESAQDSKLPVEVVVSLNRCTDRTQSIAESLGARCVVEDSKCIASVRNEAVRTSSAPAIATLDADSWMSKKTVAEIVKHVYNPIYIGGGSLMRLERFSIGIFFSFLAIAPHCIKRGLPSVGMFWFLRKSFDAIGGFDESLLAAEDLDFARRLKAYGHTQGKRYGTIMRHAGATSCRKFDRLGDWYLFHNPRIVKGIFEGEKDAIDPFYYDFKR